MKFEEAIKYLKAGWKIRRNDPLWIGSFKYIYLGRDIYGAPKIRPYYVYGGAEVYMLTPLDFCFDDWEIVTEKKRVKLRDLTFEQFVKWKDQNCEKYDCSNCPFRCIDCNRAFWMNCKDIYSDKFLDQEIEIEE